MISAYRRRKNLRDYLVKSKVSGRNKPKSKSKIDCLYTKKRIHNKQTHQKMGSISKPEIKNCIYLIQCTTCNKRYVGETGNTITTRLYQYKYNINKQNKHLTVIKHFIHHGWKAIKVMILEDDPEWTLIQRRIREKRWIHKLNTIMPYGLNDK